MYHFILKQIQWRTIKDKLLIKLLEIFIGFSAVYGPFDKHSWHTNVPLHTG